MSSFLIGGSWYGPLLGRVWTRAAGLAPEQAAKARLGLVFGVSFLRQVIAAVVLAVFIGSEATFSLAIAAAASVGVFWVAPGLGVLTPES